ncbi:uncharacterized protein [Diadema antillarum]|uniref:uncharacterized protein n=1 Tax=Diadema antillarum TaxID=105358 RepID=UPI003A8424A0
MEVRASVTAVTLFVALLAAMATGDEIRSPRLYEDSENASDFGVDQFDGLDTGLDALDNNADVFRDIIQRLMKDADAQAAGRASSHRILAAISGNGLLSAQPSASRQYDAYLADQLREEPTTLDFKRGRCRNRNCRNLEGKNPNANFRPLPFGKRSRFSPAKVAARASEFSNKRGRVKSKILTRFPARNDFLPFGRR